MFSGVNREAFVAVKGTLSGRAPIKKYPKFKQPQKGYQSFSVEVGKK